MVLLVHTTHVSDMHQLLHITILLGSLTTLRAAHINITNVNETQVDTVVETYDANDTATQIEALQKEKEDLYIKINKAIDEAIPELEKTNDTEALTGLDHLKTLKQQIKELHEANSDDDTNDIGVNDNDATFRRKLSIHVDKPANKDLPNKNSNIKRSGVDAWVKKMKKNEFQEKLIKSRDKKYTSLPRVVNRQKIAEQIQMWLIKQQEEKQKKREMRIKQKIAYERCPDYGRGKERKDEYNKQGTPRKARMYPCCRKCCKRSYLGCL